jgi:uncharacterized protein YbjT (DUF2867 family)
MKLVIFGASGQTGRLLVNQALESGHEVTVYVRREGAFETGRKGLTIVAGQLDDPAKLEQAITGADVCISTLGGGSLSKRSPELTTGIDRIVSVMERAGVKRFIYMSSVGAGDSRYYMGPIIRLFIVGIFLRVPLADHTFNEKRIASSGLQWTIIRPGGLSNGSKTGKLRHGSDFTKITGNIQISRADVAAFILEQALSTTYINKAVWLF